MQEDFQLRADSAAIELDLSGISLQAPGLIGSGRWETVGAAGGVRGEVIDDAITRGLAEAGLQTRHALHIEAETPRLQPGATRSAEDVADDELLLQVPLAADETAFVIYSDEAGVSSVHYSTGAGTLPALPTRAFGAARQQRFRMRLRTPAATPAGETRGPVGRFVAKVLRVVVVKLMPGVAGEWAQRRVQAWEDEHRAARGLHGGTAAQLLAEAPLPPPALDSLHGRRCLLFVHGTTSSTAGAFGQLLEQPAVLEALYGAYQGRVLGFNHATMSRSVLDNARDLLAELAQAPGSYEFDIVCHSRGGLLARALALAGTAALPTPAGVQVRVGRIVFVATPNLGTPLADPQRLPGFVNRMVNVLNLLPDGALVIASGAVLTLAAALAEVGLPRLPGLVDQAPGSPLQQQLGMPPQGGADWYAMAADFEPTGGLLDALKDATMDQVFAHVANDLVVPTAGVGNEAAFALPADHVLRFGPERGVHHSLFFRQPEMALLPVWLGQAAQP